VKDSEREGLVHWLSVLARSTCANPNKPGLVIQKLPKDVREKIKQLSSDDFNRVRPL